METGNAKNSALIAKKAPTMPKPQWHPPWKLYRVSDGLFLCPHDITYNCRELRNRVVQNRVVGELGRPASQDRGWTFFSRTLLFHAKYTIKRSPVGKDGEEWM